MAQVARAAPIGAPIAISGGHQPAGWRSVASAEAAPVEGISPKVAISYEEAGFLYQDYSGGAAGEGRQRLPLPGPVWRVLGASSQAFAALFEINQVAVAGAVGGAGRPGLFGAMLARAIDTYETNARVGEKVGRRGDSLNVRL